MRINKQVNKQELLIAYKGRPLQATLSKARQNFFTHIEYTSHELKYKVYTHKTDN